MLLPAQWILILFVPFQVNEYLKDIVAQEQRKRETQSAEPAGSPRVGVFFPPLLSSPSFNTSQHYT